MEDRRHLGANVGKSLIHVHGSSGDLGPIEETTQSEQASQPSFCRIAFLGIPILDISAARCGGAILSAC
jgi:hypothetical protein